MKAAAYSFLTVPYGHLFSCFLFRIWVRKVLNFQAGGKQDTDCRCLKVWISFSAKLPVYPKEAWARAIRALPLFAHFLVVLALKRRKCPCLFLSRYVEIHHNQDARDREGYSLAVYSTRLLSNGRLLRCGIDGRECSGVPQSMCYALLWRILSASCQWRAEWSLNVSAHSGVK